MKTSKQWWQEVKNDDDKFNQWLLKQYRGEVTASQRIDAFREQYSDSEKSSKILQTIAVQERDHASWVLNLLQSRGLDIPSVTEAEERYWKETLPSIESFETGCAVGAHAEKMRLERIEVICNDDEAPEDIREVFKKILKDEIFHERAFKRLAGEEAMQKTEASHKRGLEVLGLEP